MYNFKEKCEFLIKYQLQTTTVATHIKGISSFNLLHFNYFMEFTI